MSRRAAMAFASAAAYVACIRIAWPSASMDDVDHVVMAGTYIFVGLVSAALVRVAERERAARAESERSAQRAAPIQGIAAPSGALRQRDDGTGEHCGRVADLAVRVGAELGLAPERLELLHLAALAHDVGKIGVSDDVLLKPAEAEERDRVERHPAIAAELLGPIRGAEEIAEIVLCNHESPDRTGHPRHLTGDRLPVEARALRVADVFDALMERRPYKPALAYTEAIVRTRRLDGKLDPRCREALERIVGAAEQRVQT